jgi:small subunit ribosomal protein S16
MAVRLRFKRMGKRNRPFYRLGAFDKEQKRDGKPLELLGYYNPFETAKTKKFDLKLDRIQHWLKVGATPSLKVKTILKKHGIKGK